MAKRKLTVTLETVTPMFLAGADNKTPELRPPSVLGQLRYWLRAALGAVVGNDLEALKKAESEVFGDTNGTGAVQIRRMQWAGKTPKSVKKNALPHPSADHPAWMWGFPAGERFELTLSQHTDNQATWLATISGLLLMVSIGGLGRRCRRGWGTVQALNIDTSLAELDDVWDKALTSAPLNLNTALDFAEQTINRLCDDLEIATTKTNTSISYTVIEPQLMNIFLNTNGGKLWRAYQEPITEFGEAEHHWLQANPRLADSIGFARGGRQASPLWLRVLPVNGRDNQTSYIMLATLFDVDFKGANYKAVQEFLKSANFKEFPR